MRYVGADLCRSEQGVPPHCVLRSTPQDCLASCARSPHCSGVQVDAKSAETVECLLYVESLEDAVCDTAGQRFDGVGGVVDRAEENGSGQACYGFSTGTVSGPEWFQQWFQHCGTGEVEPWAEILEHRSALAPRVEVTSAPPELEHEQGVDLFQELWKVAVVRIIRG